MAAMRTARSQSRVELTPVKRGRPKHRSIRHRRPESENSQD